MTDQTSRLSLDAGMPPSWQSRTVLRHAIVLALAGALIYGFSLIHGQWSPMHRWNRAFADASVIILALTMSIGPGARLLAALRPFVVYRREMGIHGTILAAIHTMIVLVGWLEWDFARLFGFEFHPQLQVYVMAQHGFGLANFLGILALLYGAFLAITSNDRSVRLLGPSVWKFFQTAATTLWIVIVLHTGYFLFMHFLSFHRQTPEPNPLQWFYVAVVSAVFLVRAAAFLATWRRHKGRQSQFAG